MLHLDQFSVLTCSCLITMLNITHKLLEKWRCEVSRKFITKGYAYCCAYFSRGNFHKFMKVYLTNCLDLVVCESLSSYQFTPISLEKYKKIISITYMIYRWDSETRLFYVGALFKPSAFLLFSDNLLNKSLMSKYRYHHLNKLTILIPCEEM